MSEITMVEMYPQNKKSTIAIRPFFNENIDNMGLQKYGLSLFEGAFHEESIACLEVNGTKRFLTGLNEFAPEITDLPLDERDAKIKQIRIMVSDLEKRLGSNVVDPTDPEFWNKVKLLKPDNFDFWDRIKIKCSNEPLFLDPAKDPFDIIRLCAVEAGGFSLVARSLEDARKMAVPPKFYLDRLEESATTNTEVKKLRNKAAAELQKLYDKNQNKMFYVAKTLDPNSAQYKKSTPNDILYDNLDKFINGELVDKNKKATATKFLETADLNMETLKIKAIVKDASFYKFIAVKSDGHIYHMQQNALMGRNLSDVVEFLKNPLNEEILVDLTAKVERFWNQ